MSGADNLKEYIYGCSPYWAQNFLITVYNLKAYSYRYGGNYSVYLEEFRENERKPVENLKEIQFKRLIKFLKYAKNNSDYYNRIIPDNFIENLTSVEGLRELPILTKEDVRKNINDLITISDTEGIEAKTGGTTGTSLRVLFTKEDIQRRTAHVDYHRGKRGYKPGKKTAWFSGKKIINERDIKKGRYWKTDYLKNVRYYSTFHISPETTKSYLNNICRYKPEYLVGFPSAIFELAKAGLNTGLEFPRTVKAIFPNAETISVEMRSVIEKFFNAEIFDQYGSSEGIPHIFEGGDGIYHHNPEVGILEVLDEADKPSKKGRLVVTPFFTSGTPLIRYDIGDYVEAINNEDFPSDFKKIYGRSSDFIYSKTNGKINSANIANCSKGVRGLVKFKLIQNELSSVKVDYVADKTIFTKDDMVKFISNLRDRLGNKMSIDFNHVEDIPKENSGKYRIIENNIISEL